MNNDSNFQFLSEAITFGLKYDFNKISSDLDFDLTTYSISNIKLPNQAITGKLYLGSLPSLEIYKNYNIEYIVSIYDLEESLIQHNIEHDIFRIDDLIDKDTVIKMNNILQSVSPKIHTYLTNGKNVLVHCFAGMSRSATMVLDYLLKYHDFKDMPTTEYENISKCKCVIKAINYVKLYRPIIVPNTAFIKLLLTNHNNECNVTI